MSSAMTNAPTAATYPADRSISLNNNAKISARPRSTNTAACTNRLTRFPAERNCDTWDWKILISVNSDSRFKSGGINFVDGRIYWAADANGPKVGLEHDRGIFTCAPADLTNKETHTLTAPEKEAKPRKSAEVIDLMDILKQSLAKGGKSAGGRAGPHRAPSKRAAKKKRA